MRIDRAFAEIEADASIDRSALLTSTGTLASFRARVSVYTGADGGPRGIVLGAAAQSHRIARPKGAVESAPRRAGTGEIVGVGEIWDVVMESPEPFGDAMRANAEQAQRLYREKLRPLLLADAGIMRGGRAPSRGKVRSARTIGS